MRLIIYSQYFPPETGAPQNRLGDLTRRLRDRGHEIAVVTAMPNYPSGRVYPEWRRKLAAREVVDGITVLRSWIWPTASGSTARQLATYGSFLISSTLTAPFRSGRSDVVLWESPPLFLAPTAWLLARWARAALVMNVSDLWPDSAVSLGVLSSRFLIHRFERLERWAYEAADLITCQTDGILEGVRRRAPESPAALFPNGVDVALFRPQPRTGVIRARYGIPHDAAVVGYAGNFGRAQALEQVVEAATLLRHRSDIWFVLLGAGPRRAEIDDLLSSRRLPRVVLLEPVPSAEIPSVQAEFDVGIVPLADVPLFHGARPSKMFELMAGGVPFVFCGRGEGADLARRSRGAETVAPERPHELSGAIEKLVDAGTNQRRVMGEAARQFVASHFDRSKIAADLEGRLLEVVARRRRR